jgi:hypothetical protein
LTHKFHKLHSRPLKTLASPNPLSVLSKQHSLERYHQQRSLESAITNSADHSAITKSTLSVFSLQKAKNATHSHYPTPPTLLPKALFSLPLLSKSSVHDLRHVDRSQYMNTEVRGSGQLDF